MAQLTQLESNIISKGIEAAKLVVEQLYPLLKRLNIDYDSQGGAKTTITQEGLDAVSSFSNLTKTQLDDAMYALTATLRGDIETAFAQLEQLASRG